MLGRTRRLIVRIFEGTVLAFLVVLASYVSMGRIVVANIDSLRHDVEQALANALAIEVEIDGLDGGWTHLDPEIVISGLSIGSAETPAITIHQASARIDTIGSLRQQGIVIRDITVDGVRLSLVQDKTGWFVEGLPRTGNPINPDPLLDSLKYLRSLVLSGVDVEITTLRESYHLTNQPGAPFELFADDTEKHLLMPLLFHRADGSVSELQLQGQYRGDPRQRQQFAADLHLRLPPIDVSGLISQPIADLNVTRFLAGGEFWLNWRPERFELIGLTRVSDFRIEREDQTRALVSEMSASFVAFGASIDDVEVYVDTIEGRLGQRPISTGDISFALTTAPESSEFAIRLPEVNLGRVSALAVGLGQDMGLVSDAGAEAIEKLNARGRLTEVLVTGDLADAIETLKVTARVDGVGLDAVSGSPAVSSISGFLSATPSEGYLDLDNEAFQLEFALFPEPWPLDHARARISYRYAPGYIQVNSGLVRLGVGDLTASGRFSLNLPTERVNRTWGLEIGVRDADLGDASRYLPATVGENLIEWLNSAVKGGNARESGLLFHGALDRVGPKIGKVHELYFKVDKATLEYAPEWPTVTDLAASIYIGNWGVFSGDAAGSVFDSRVSNGVVTVPIDFGEQVDSVLVDADVTGPLSDGIRILLETPVAATTSRFAEGWVGEGGMTGSLNLNVPLGPRAGEPVGVNVDLRLEGNRINMTPYQLDVLSLSGKLNYNNVTGVTANNVRAKLFDYPVTARLATEAGDTGGAVGVFLEGQIDVEDLYEWSGQSLLTRATGSMDYSAHLHVPYGARSRELIFVEATSNLVGVDINLPVPMKKTREEITSLVYRQSFLDSGFRVDIDLGALTRASFKADEGYIRGGRLHFGNSPLGVVAYDDIRVSGELAFIDYQEWEQVTRALDQKTEVSLTSEMANQLDAIDVHARRMVAFGIELEDVDAYITRDSDAWNVKLTNALLGGLIKVPDAEELPLAIDLGYLRFVSSEEEAGTDPLSDADPTEFVPIDFSVAELMVDDDNYGKWSFQFRPTATGAELGKLAAEVKGLSIGDGSRVLWNVAGGTHSSRFEGDVNIADLALAFRQWGFAPSIEGEGFKLGAEVTWPGSPAMVDIDTMNGLVHLRKGSGRFVQAQSGTGALKLLGMFDFASLARRLRFDFSDVVDEGFTFTEASGAARFDKGVVSVVEPLVIVGSGSTFKVGGSVDLNTNQLDNDMIVTLPVSRNLPWYAAYSAIATGPLAGVSVWLAQKVFENQIDQMSSAKYKISGTIDKPEVDFISIFSDSVRESTAEGDASAGVKQGATGE